ncbi:anti-sigma factor antagonist [Nonomuraea longispora]|uniref:Anti-sigma factor antagonist n=1 Tax=Nonomuraea longispora TaxID=1848320 RepID=A0A4R4N9G0_9ACTN|nr:STAS domain-containing protein [Nonomuraea longispora]TDC03607.1 anti-sigma factor antagonist [Nonomuraea longispora]
MNATYTPSATALVIDALIEQLLIALSPAVATGGLLRVTPLTDRAGLWIEGELDLATLPALRRALALMASRGTGFCVEVSGVAFIDTGCLRALVGAAAKLHDGGGDHQLTLRSPPPQMRRLLKLTGWDQTPGLCLVN